MKIKELKCKIRHVNMPRQPFIEASTIDYQNKLTRLNPFTEKEGGLFYQFRTPDTPQSFMADFIPDACVNMLFRCDEKNPKAFILGIYDQLHTVELKPGMQYFGVVPYSGFLGIKEWRAVPSELRESQYDFADVIGNKALCETIVGLHSFEERINYFKKYFVENLADQNYYNSLPGVLSINSCCAAGNISVGEIEDLSGYSYSYCRKSFLEHFGVSVKRYSQAIRLSQAITLLLQNNAGDSEKQDMVDIALKTGFYDESHFIHEFKRYSGYSPRRFVNHIGELRKKTDSLAVPAKE